MGVGRRWGARGGGAAPPLVAVVVVSVLVLAVAAGGGWVDAFVLGVCVCAAFMVAVTITSSRGSVGARVP